MRNLWVLGLLAGLGGPTYGHFYFVLPGGEAGAAAKLVIGDGPAPDASAARDYGRPESFRAVAKSGRVTPLTVDTGDGTLRSTGQAEDPAEVFGSVVIGVVKRGQVEPVLVVHHPRAVFDPDSRGAITADVKDPPALSIRPVAAGGSVSFVVSAKGKPQAQADVTVYEPGEPRPRTVKTGANGVTPAFSKPGRYAARVYWLEPAPGEHQGRKYAAVRHYATITVAVGPQIAGQ
ncbi:MAG: hypothetical protein U0871_11275 [Gemmataceae bacterium]